MNWKKRFFLEHRHALQFGITVPVFVILLVLTSQAGHVWTLESIGIRAQEVFIRSMPVNRAKFCSIVSITPDNYKQVFKNDCVSKDGLKRIKDRLLRYRPALLLIDIDTSGDRFAGLDPGESQLKPGEKGTPVLWARDAGEGRDAKGNTDLPLFPVLGNQHPDANTRWGLALFPQSPDATVRVYQRTFVANGKPAPSLYWLAAKTFCSETESGRSERSCDAVRRRSGVDADEEYLYLPSAHSRYTFDITPLDDILQSGTERDAGKDPDEFNSLRDRIVLLGGAYSPADIYPTPWGRTKGVEILASAIEAELKRGSPQYIDLPFWFMLFLKMALGGAVVWANHFLKPLWALFFTGGLLVASLFGGTFLALYLLGYRANFIVFIVGIWIEQLVEGALEAEKAQRALQQPAH